MDTNNETDAETVIAFLYKRCTGHEGLVIQAAERVAADLATLEAENARLREVDKAMFDHEYRQREEIHALRSLLSQACSAYSNEYGDELSREVLDNILGIIGPKRLGLAALSGEGGK